MRRSRTTEVDAATAARDRWRAWSSSPRLPVGLLLLVLALDAFRASVRLDLVGNALTDEPAHVSTALLVMLAVTRPATLDRRRAAVVAAVVSSVAIDVDHLPLYAGVEGIAGAGRPVTHSLATVALLLAAALVRGRSRALLAGAAAGVGLHLVRDVATGPGAPLLWPWTSSHVLVPYWAYATLLVLLALVAVRRRLRAAPERP